MLPGLLSLESGFESLVLYWVATPRSARQGKSLKCQDLPC